MTTLYVGGTQGVPAQKRALCATIRRLRTNPFTMRSKIIIACEGAPGLSASHIYQNMLDAQQAEPRTFGDVHFLCRVPERGSATFSPGIVKTKAASFAYEELMSRLIVSENMAWSSDLKFYISDDHEDVENDISEGLRRFEDMLFNYRREIVNGVEKVTSKGEQNNDIFSATETGFYWFEQYLTNKEFEDERRNSGYYDLKM